MIGKTAPLLVARENGLGLWAGARIISHSACWHSLWMPALERLMRFPTHPPTSELGPRLASICQEGMVLSTVTMFGCTVRYLSENGCLRAEN